jgi:hypothetical protein
MEEGFSAERIGGSWFAGKMEENFGDERISTAGSALHGAEDGNRTSRGLGKIDR